MEPKNVLEVRNLSKTFVSNGKEVHALKNISFELEKGQILGVIGRNGAGKSTLLKILSRISTPSSGEVEYLGSMGSILKIGSGFHPDLSGRENINLNLNLYGVKRDHNTIKSIIDFAGLESYIDLPVKQYSDGMYLRLAFSIAFHSDFDILVLDEVIAVGDKDFRSKCYAKIRALKKHGSSIILVSHDLDSIKGFADKCILLDAGNLKLNGRTNEVLNDYLLSNFDNRDLSINNIEKSTGIPHMQEFRYIPEQMNTQWFKLKSVDIQSSEGNIIDTSNSFLIEIQLDKKSEGDSLEVFLSISDLNNTRLLTDSYGLRDRYIGILKQKGNYAVGVEIPAHLIPAGYYSLGLNIGIDQEIKKEFSHVLLFEIKNSSKEPDRVKQWKSQLNSIIQPQLNWLIKKVDE